MLSIQAVRGLPRLRAHGIVLCIIFSGSVEIYNTSCSVLPAPDIVYNDVITRRAGRCLCNGFTSSPVPAGPDAASAMVSHVRCSRLRQRLYQSAHLRNRYRTRPLDGL